MPFPYKVALITGATEGIGRATGFALGRAGYRVSVCARTEAKVRRLVDELQSVGIEAAGAPAEAIPLLRSQAAGLLRSLRSLAMTDRTASRLPLTAHLSTLPHAPNRPVDRDDCHTGKRGAHGSRA